MTPSAPSQRRVTDAESAAVRGPTVSGEVSPNAEVVSDPHAAAFFDVDNTLLRGASIYYLARGLWSRKFFSTRELAGGLWQQVRFRVSGSENHEHLNDVREKALSFIAGWRVSDLEELAEEIFDEVVATKVWPGTRALAQRHLDRGERVWLITATPTEIAGLLARRLELTGAIGTVAETVDGVYTGRLEGDLMHGAAKAEAVRALAERERLDLSRCSAYSDSANDVPMLSLVGDPYAINPDTRLKIHAKTNGWRIRDFRTGRRAARLGLFIAAGAGAATGAGAAALALSRNRVWYRPSDWRLRPRWQDRLRGRPWRKRNAM